MASDPLDWVTGEVLGSTRVRELEAQKKLVRRHVFPPAQFGTDLGSRIKLGLNGVLLCESSPALSACDPAKLLELVQTLTPRGGIELDELELRRRLHSHHVDWLAVKRQHVAPNYRYSEFLESRASNIVLRAEELASY